MVLYVIPPSMPYNVCLITGLLSLFFRIHTSTLSKEVLDAFGLRVEYNQEPFDFESFCSFISSAADSAVGPDGVSGVVRRRDHRI